MKKVLNKIKYILLGNWYNLRGINYELMKKRMDICNTCDKKVHLTKNVSLCSECGCILKAKTRIKDEDCLLGKWE